MLRSLVTLVTRNMFNEDHFVWTLLLYGCSLYNQREIMKKRKEETFKVLGITIAIYEKLCSCIGNTTGQSRVVRASVYCSLSR